MAGHTELLLRNTRRRLFAQTLALVMLLVVGVGAATLVVGLNALDADVDRALRATVTSAASSVADDMPEPGEDDERDHEERPLGEADTVLVVLGPTGQRVQDLSGHSLGGMPDVDALPNARSTGEDLRTITTGAVNVRLLTVPLVHDGRLVGYLQGGFDLQLHDSQSQSLVMAVIIVGAMGLVAAAAITLLVTGRALVPIREGFDARRRFVADASHELRTPAALIRANAEVIEREHLVADAGRPLLDDVIAEADRLGRLVGDLLQLAAWDEMRLSISPAAIDVGVLAAETVRGMTALAAERMVRLEGDIASHTVAMADRHRLIQLLHILIDNAIDHSPSGGLVTVRVLDRDRMVEIDVDDEGPGIPEADRERIFQPFTRLAGNTRHGSGGTGLGLAIARRIVDAHAGRIRADSPAGRGARFTVELPAAGGRRAPAAESPAPDANRSVLPHDRPRTRAEAETHGATRASE